MNSKNQVVGWYTASGVSGAFIWLPEPDYGVECGMHDLNVVIGIVEEPHQAESSRAFAISDNGIVVGVYGNEPFVWNLSEGPTEYSCTHITADEGSSPCDSTNVIEREDLFCPGDPGFLCAAHDVNDNDPAVVVGYFRKLDDCFNSRPFKLTLGANSSSPTFEELNTFFADEVAYVQAFGIGRAANATPRIVGRYTQAQSDCEGPFFACAYFGCPSPDPQDCPMFAAQWHGLSSTQMPHIALNHEHAAYAVNDDGNIVGYGRECLEEKPSPEYLRQRATFWASATSSPQILVTEPDDDEPGRANAITNDLGNGELVVVGQNEVGPRALLWHREDSTSGWSASELIDFVVGACTAEDWVLRNATGITDDLAICGWGETTVGIRAFILLPGANESECTGDLNSDGVVNGADLGIVLANWTGDVMCNDCHATCNGCRGDINGDCQVNGDDLGQVLAQWGTCPPFGDCPEENGIDEQVMEAAEQGDYMPLFYWLLSKGEEQLAVKLLQVTSGGE